MDKQELLDWAVENVDEWNVGYCLGNGIINPRWVTGAFAAKAGVIITQQEWLEAKHKRAAGLPSSDSESMFAETNLKINLDEPPLVDTRCDKDVELNDMVHKPKHYEIMPDIESLDLIVRSMTMEMWKGACLFNVMKYRLRCGKKDNIEQELGKADNFANSLYEKYLPLCYDYKK